MICQFYQKILNKCERKIKHIIKTACFGFQNKAKFSENSSKDQKNKVYCQND